MFEILMPWKNKIDEIEKEEKTEQKPLVPEKEPETKVIDATSTVNYVSLYNSEFSDVKELINTYRSMAINFEISEALDEIENEAVVFEKDESITVNTDKIELSDNIKEKITEEFDYILSLLNWKDNAFELFRDWFVDGRLYQQKVMSKKPKGGLEKIITLDPLKIQRVKNKKTKEVYFIYKHNDEETYRIPKEAIAFTSSGLKDPTKSYWVSELHKSIRPLNNLRLIEDSAIIYYITRAPSKRAFYIDVGNVSSKKAEQKVKQMMQKFRQRISYDSTAGKIIQQKRSIPVNEDFYLATRGDTRGTKIESIVGDTNLLNPEMLSYFKKKLYKSLAVPYARVDDDTSGSVVDFSSPETTSQELKFSKQTDKRRNRFSHMFDDLLKTQLITKKIITKNEWDKIKEDLYYDWKNNSYYTMLKQFEVLQKQVNVAQELEPYVGLYFSHEYVRKHVFGQTDDDIEQQDKQIEEEKKDQKYQTEEDDI